MGRNRITIAIGDVEIDNAGCSWCKLGGEVSGIEGCRQRERPHLRGNVLVLDTQHQIRASRRKILVWVEHLN